ncbi:MAG: hypothetical protein ACRC7S_05505 [Cetobacterium sp.]
MIGCKNGCLCNDINKELCCVECDYFNTCKEYCLEIKNIGNNNILFKCEKSFEIKDDNL